MKKKKNHEVALNISLTIGVRHHGNMVQIFVKQKSQSPFVKC